MFPVQRRMVPVCRTIISRSMLLCGFILTLQSAASSHVPFRLGQNLILKCQVLRDADIAAVLWTRLDLKVDVCFYRDGRCDPENQHPSYEHRVDLADQDLKDGNVSVILRNVSDSDVGTYQCHIKEFRDGHVETSGSICTIRASLEAPDATAGNITAGNITAGNTTAGNITAGNTTAGNMTADGGLNHVGLIVGLTVVAPVVLCIFVGVCFFHRKKQQLEPPVLYKALRYQLIWLLTPGQESTSKSSDDQDPAGPPSKQQI